jgi:hypothetical protein
LNSTKDLFVVEYYKFEEMRVMCGKNHDIEIGYKSGKATIVFVSGLEQK